MERRSGRGREGGMDDKRLERWEEVREQLEKERGEVSALVCDMRR